MFVEIVRLFIVFIATAVGFSLGRGGASYAGNGAVIGATLGACLGYVGGGVIGRALGVAAERVENTIDRAPAGQLLAGILGAAALGTLSALLALPALFLLPITVGWSVMGLLVWIGAYEGYAIAARKAEDLLALAGLSTRPLVRVSAWGKADQADLVDTSAIIDGRLLAVARAGFLQAALLVPQFVLDELQSIADAADPIKRRKGQRGLDLLRALQRQPGVDVHVIHDEVADADEVDAKLLALARRLKVGLVTVDGNLQRVAELQGVRCLNLERLAGGLRPALVPGETVSLHLDRVGTEEGQGVGFLDDGTMVVVGGGAGLVGAEVDVRITGNVQTSVGRMFFASLV